MKLCIKKIDIHFERLHAVIMLWIDYLRQDFVPPRNDSALFLVLIYHWQDAEHQRYRQTARLYASAMHGGGLML